MQRYRCPKCGYTFYGKIKKCPQCKVLFRYPGDPLPGVKDIEEKAEEEKLEEQQEELEEKNEDELVSSLMDELNS